MIDQVDRYMRHRASAAPGTPLWVAVSGGVDSMVLLHALRSLGHACHVAHVDHGLRAEASRADEAFIARYCAEWDIPFRSKEVDVTGGLAPGRSVQMAARELRYAWFNELVEEGPSLMALAHHADDAVETMLLGLMRGTGPKGLAGIPAEQGPFIRPLLGVPRAAIEAYAREHDVPYREDASNHDGKYLRNRVRHELLPLFDAIRPGAGKVLRRQVTLLKEAAAVLDAHLADIAASFTERDGKVQVPFDRVRTSLAPHALLQRLLADRGFHPDAVSDMLVAIDEERTGATFHGKGHAVHVDRGYLVIEAVPRAFPQWTIATADDVPADLPLAIARTAALDPGARKDPNIAWLDSDRLGFPCTLRPWREGDRMRPVGLGGSKLISDLLIDAKVPRHEKPGTYVLVSGGRIAWCCGHRVAEGYQATAASRAVLRLTWSKTGGPHL